MTLESQQLDSVAAPRCADAVIPRSRNQIWIETLSHVDPVFGGVTAVVPGLAVALREHQRVDALIAPFCNPDENQLPAMLDPEILTRWPASRSTWLRSGKLWDDFRDYLSVCEGVHIHGLWEACSLVSARAARAQRKPYIVSAHGMLEPWALAQKALKKKIYSYLVEAAVLQNARCLHALTSAEARDYRRFGCKAPIAVIPNAVQRPDFVDHELFLTAFPELRAQRILLFLGRLHHKKGVRLLIESWTRLQRDHPETTLVLAGPKETQGESPERIIDELGLQDRVFCTGMLSPPMKWSALASAYAFILPSFSEGLSIAALEALAMGVPAIVSKACNLPEIAAFGAGFETGTTVQTLATVLQDAMSLSPASWRAMSSQAARLADTKFSWTSVSAQMAKLYEWVVSDRSPSSLGLFEEFA